MYPRLGRFTRSLIVLGVSLISLLAIFRFSNRRSSSLTHVTEIGRKLDLIFVGGVPRSGTTLMRALLDAHPRVRCGEETRILPRITGFIEISEKEKNRFQEAKISNEVLDNAFASFILHIVTRPDDRTDIRRTRFCNKDPFMLKYVDHLNRLFPEAKFILMIRDGRAVVNSLISRKVTVTTFNLSDHSQCLKRWNDLVSVMRVKCALLPKQCLQVHYEKLVLDPKHQLKRILSFLELEWTDRVLHHETEVGSKISISKLERSSDQIALPINAKPLTSWVKHFPVGLRKKVDQIAPMLRVLGYDTVNYPPIYGKADNFVLNNTRYINEDSDIWKERITRLLARTEDDD